MTDSLVLVSLGLSFIIVVQFIALINFRYKYLTTLRIIDSNVLPNSVTTFLGLLVTSFAVFASIVIWHYRSKYNNVLSFKSSTIEGNLNEVVVSSTLANIQDYTFFATGAYDPPEFEYLPLPGRIQVSRVKQTDWGSFKGNTLLCPSVTPGTLPQYDPVNNTVTVYNPPMSSSCTQLKNTCYIFGNPTNLLNTYNEHFQNDSGLFVFSNFDGNAQTLTARIFLPSPRTTDYVYYYFINRDEWFEINPPRKFFSVSCGGQVLFNATGHEITYTLDNEGNLGGYQPSKIFGGPFTFTLKNGDSIYIPENLFARYIQTQLEATDGSPL
jgi:hypothetical protein